MNSSHWKKEFMLKSLQNIIPLYGHGLRKLIAKGDMASKNQME